MPPPAKVTVGADTYPVPGVNVIVLGSISPAALTSAETVAVSDGPVGEAVTVAVIGPGVYPLPGSSTTTRPIPKRASAVAPTPAPLKSLMTTVGGVT